MQVKIEHDDWRILIAYNHGEEDFYLGRWEIIKCYDYLESKMAPAQILPSGWMQYDAKLAIEQSGRFQMAASVSKRLDALIVTQEDFAKIEVQYPKVFYGHGPVSIKRDGDAIIVAVWPQKQSPAAADEAERTTDENRNDR